MTTMARVHHSNDVIAMKRPTIIAAIAWRPTMNVAASTASSTTINWPCNGRTLSTKTIMCGVVTMKKSTKIYAMSRSRPVCPRFIYNKTSILVFLFDLKWHGMKIIHFIFARIFHCNILLRCVLSYLVYVLRRFVLFDCNAEIPLFSEYWYLFYFLCVFHFVWIFRFSASLSLSLPLSLTHSLSVCILVSFYCFRVLSYWCHILAQHFIVIVPFHSQLHTKLKLKLIVLKFVCISYCYMPVWAVVFAAE